MHQARILLLAGSNSAGSASSRLAGAFSRELAFLDAAPTHISLADYPLPLHDPDMPAEAPPLNAVRLRGLFKTHHAAFIVTPEVNGSIPALLKNALDWLADGTENRNRPASGRIFAIGGVSLDGTGARIALDHLRSVLAEGFAATILGRGLALAHADTAFDDKGRLEDPRQAAALQALAREIVHVSRRLTIEA